MTIDDDCRELRIKVARSFLDLLILQILVKEPLWGYRLMSVLQREYDIRAGPPIIYPLLNSMEEDGLVESEDVYIRKRRRRIYRPTEKGLGLLECFRAIVSDIFEDRGQHA